MVVFVRTDTRLLCGLLLSEVYAADWRGTGRIAFEVLVAAPARKVLRGQAIMLCWQAIHWATRGPMGSTRQLDPGKQRRI